MATEAKRSFRVASFEDEIEIRHYIDVLLRKWDRIVAVGLLAGVLALVVSMVQTPVYEAEGTILISPSRTEVQFDNRIQTLADYEIGGSSIALRRDALTALVQSNEVVQAVMERVEDRLQSEERDINWLRSIVTLQTAGDLINIGVRHPDPETATVIANVWIEEYERHVNQIFANRVNVTNSRISEQVSEARESYESAQLALETFIAVDPAEALQRELDAKIAVLDNFQRASIASQARPVDRNQQVLDGYFQELEQIEILIADAEALRDQVLSDTGSDAANLGNTLALITLRSRAFARDQWIVDAEGSITVLRSGPNLQLELGSLSAAEVNAEDVESLISTLNARRGATQERIDAFLLGFQTIESQPELATLNARIASLAEEINGLQSQVEAASAQQRELTQARDRAWETFQLLLNRQVEEQVASQAASVEVRIADRAVVPTESVGRGTLRNTVAAAVLGLIVSAGVVLARAWWVTDRDPIDAIEVGERSEPNGEDRGHASDPVSPQRVPETMKSRYAE